MRLRTGLKALIGISVLGIAVAVLLIYTCPFAGQIAFSTLVREVPTEHGGGLVRSYPVKETKLFAVEVSPLGIIVLLVLIALCFVILRQRPLNLFGYAVTPKAMGVTIFLITLWNLLFSAFLLGVEVVQLKEL